MKIPITIMGNDSSCPREDRPKEEPDMSVRLPEKFYNDATEAVTGQKAPKTPCQAG